MMNTFNPSDVLCHRMNRAKDSRSLFYLSMCTLLFCALSKFNYVTYHLGLYSSISWVNNKLQRRENRRCCPWCEKPNLEYKVKNLHWNSQRIKWGTVLNKKKKIYTPVRQCLYLEKFGDIKVGKKSKHEIDMRFGEYTEVNRNFPTWYINKQGMHFTLF